MSAYGFERRVSTTPPTRCWASACRWPPSIRRMPPPPVASTSTSRRALRWHVVADGRHPHLGKTCAQAHPHAGGSGGARHAALGPRPRRWWRLVLAGRFGAPVAAARGAAPGWRSLSGPVAAPCAERPGDDRSASLNLFGPAPAPGLWRRRAIADLKDSRRSELTVGKLILRFCPLQLGPRLSESGRSMSPYCFG